MKWAFGVLILWLAVLFTLVFLSIEQIEDQLSAHAGAIIAIAKKVNP